MEKLPKGIILAAHKPIASAMLKAATQIMGPIDHCAAADIDSDAKESDQFEHLKKVWDSVQTEEMIILLDIEGATPCNVLKKYTSGKRCMLVSPLSFPLFFKMLTYRSKNFEPRRRKSVPLSVFQESAPVKTIEVEVINRLGLHARPAAKLTQKANEFLSEIKIDKDGRVVNGKSIMGVMLLAASKGTVLKISADGTDEESALQQLKELFDTKFGEQD